MTDRMAIVPMPPDAQMIDSITTLHTTAPMALDKINRAIAASPNAGKVSREAFDNAVKEICKSQGVNPAIPIYFGTDKTAAEGYGDDFAVGLRALGLEIE